MKLIDPADTFDRTKRSVEEALAEHLQIDGVEKSLRVTNVRSVDTLDPWDIKSQQDARDNDRTWGVPVVGDVELVDRKTGAVIDRSRGTRLVVLPKITPRFSFIVDGNESQVKNQLRLRSGAYTMKSGAGVKTQVNTSKGSSFFIHFDPTRKDWSLQIRKSKANPMFDVLSALGISEDEMRAELGDDAVNVLKSKSRTGAIESLFKTLYREPAKDKAEADRGVRAYFEQNTAVSPDTTEYTLGRAFSTASGPLMLAAMKKQLLVNRGQAAPDERDSFIFKEPRMLDNHLSTRLEFMMGKERKDARTWRLQAARRIDRADSAAKAIRAIDPGKHIKAFFLVDSLEDKPKLTNPVTQIDNYTVTTITGEGGVKPRAITDAAMALHPSTIGLLDPVHTPESSMVGSQLHFASNVTRLKDGSVATEFVNAKTGKREYLTAAQISRKVIAFPEGFKFGHAAPVPLSKQVPALNRGREQVVDAAAVEYVLPDARSMFDPTLNLVPFLNSTSGARGVMAGKMLGQALSLVDEHREAPLVQTEAPSGKSYEEEIARLHLPKAPDSGTVTKVTDDYVEIRTDKGEKKRVGLYNLFRVGTSNQFHHNTPKVAAGDKVAAGQVLAESNFTKDGKLALGRNLTVAYIPYKGLNFEDAVVMSESAARKMTSQHLDVIRLNKLSTHKLGLREYRTIFPGRWPQTVYSKFDDDGVVREGQEVDPGEPVILALVPSAGISTQASDIIRKLMKRPYRDAALLWDDSERGRVVKVVKTPTHISVHIRADHPTKVGDKFAGRYGNKGVVSAIIPDREMPHEESGDPIDVLMNPLGVPGRINPSQLMETALGKTGQTTVIRNFTDRSNIDAVKKTLKQKGVSDTSTLVDPTSGRKIPGIMVGKQYILKLEHEAEEKTGSRGIQSYSSDEEPGKGADSNPQKFDHLTLFAMLAHGARANIRDMATYKASRNDDFWHAIQNRQPIPAPKPKFVWGKLDAYLKQLGVNMTRDGDSLRLAPLTDQELMRLSAGEIKDAGFVRAKDLRPEPGNLFDPAVTGGLRGTKWSHFTLPEPIPNPTFVDTINALTGINEKTFDQIMASEVGVKDGKVVPADQATAFRGAAVRELLGRINVRDEIAKAEQEIERTKDPTKRNRLYRRIRYLRNLDELKLRPEQAFMLRMVPVIPPRYRAMYPLPNGDLELPEINKLYKSAIVLRNKIAENKRLGIPDEFLRDAHREMYHAVAAIQGYEQPLQGNRSYRGVMALFRGKTDESSSPKEGWFQKRFFKPRQDLSGRSPIVNGPDLNIDEVALPEEMAWKIFEPFVIRELVSSGLKPIQAKQHVDNKTSFARRSLELAMEKRPVWLNRAPSLHRHSIMAFRPIITPGHSIKLHPFVYKGFNADNDGDTMAVHVPATDEAAQEAADFLPSKHVFKTSGEILTAPSNESQWGLWLLTRAGKKTSHSFASDSAALEAYRKGTIKADDVISVGGKETTAGRVLINSFLPPKLQDPGVVLTANRTKDIIGAIAKHDPKSLPAVLDRFKDLGYSSAYEFGGTLTLDDVTPWAQEREAILKKTRGAVRRSGAAKALAPTIKELDAVLAGTKKENNLVSMIHSGAAKKLLAARQMVLAPVLFTDSMGRVVESPVERSFSEGLRPGEYWTSLYGARLGVIGRSKSTEKPGALANALLQTTIDNVVTMVDCKTSRGRYVSVDGDDALGRFPATPAAGVHLGQPITPSVLQQLRKRGVKAINVRTPLRCEAGKGTCALCWGLNENGQVPKVGTNVGVLSGQALTEPSTQLTMNTFHSGGVYEPGKQRRDDFRDMSSLLKVSGIPNKAVLAKATGKVTKISDAALGGKVIHVNRDEHIVPVDRHISVAVGQQVKAGDSLTDGIKDPKELARLTSLHHAQEYIADELRRIYKSTAVVPLKHFESVVRSSAGDVAILKDPTNTFVTGQPAAFAHVDALEAGRAKRVPARAAAGHRLMERIKGHEELFGRILTKDEALRLGKAKVLATENPIVFEPTWRGVEHMWRSREDWLSNLAFQHLDDNIRRGAAQGWRSKLHGTNPLPAVFYGAELRVAPGPRGEY